MDALGKLMNFDRRIIYVVMLVLVSIPLINPLGIPLDINPMTQDVYNQLDSLQAGDRVLFSINYDPTSAPDIHPQAVVVMKHMMAKGVKVALVTFAASGADICDQLIRSYEEQGKVYGEDFVNLGFIAGAETAIRNLGRDVVGTAKVDYRGNDLRGVPMMQGIVDARDFELVYVFHGYNPGVQEWVRQVQGPLDIRLVAGVVMVSVPEVMPFYTSGQLGGLMQGLRGAAEYELLINQPGSAVAKMDAQSLGHLTIIFFIAIGNIAYFIEKKRVKK
jgi:hypothetical protein